MPPARRTRERENSQPSYDGGSDSDGTDVESTPKPKRQGLKKRLSVYNPDNNASFSVEHGRLPLKSVNINDDGAERRRRRKSYKFESSQLGPSSETQGNEQEPGLNDTPRAARQKRLASVAPPEMVNVPLDVMSSNFEEWMKMATDNVSNSKWTTRKSINLIFSLEN